MKKNDFVPYLSNLTRTFPNITDLTLSLTITNLWNSRSTGTLKNSMINGGFILSKKMLNLRHLTLRIYRYPKEGFAEFICQIGRYSQNIESLRIQYNELKDVDDEELKALSKGLDRWFCNLKKLSIDLKGCNSITDTGISSLLPTIGRRLSMLKDFHLDLGKCRFVSDATIQELEINLAKKLPNLESLALSFNWCNKIDDHSIRKLCSGTLSAFPNLKQFALWIWFKKITKSGLQTLGRSISQHLVNLERLELGIVETSFLMHINRPTLIDNEVQFLLQQISGGLKKLRKFSLIFDLCDGITDTGARIIGSSIGRDLNNFQELRLYFNRSPKITNAGFQALISRLCSSPTKLQALELNFREPTKISDEGLDGVIQTMAEGLQQLKRLYLDFAGIQNISAEVKRRLRQALQNIPVLKVKESLEENY